MPFPTTTTAESNEIDLAELGDRYRDDDEVNWLSPSAFQGTNDPSALQTLNEYFHRELAGVDWTKDEDMIMLHDLIQFAMEVAWHRGWNAAEAARGGVEFFAISHLGIKSTIHLLIGETS
jgi:hypothetical protein